MKQDYAEMIGKVAKEVGVESIPKDSEYRIDAEGIIRKKKEMLSDAELNMMDAKAYVLYIIDQHVKNTKTEGRISKSKEARAFIVENMPESVLPIMGAIPTIGEDENGFFAMVTVNGFEVKIANKATKNETISEWNKSARLMA